MSLSFRLVNGNFLALLVCCIRVNQRAGAFSFGALTPEVKNESRGIPLLYRLSRRRERKIVLVIIGSCLVGWIVAEVKLRTGETVLLDDCDLHILQNCHAFYRKISRHTRIVYVQVGLREISGLVKYWALRRLVLGAPKGMHVDHRNHNGLDNRRENLRLATHTENMRNRRKAHLIASSSDYKGSRWTRFCPKPWHSSISVNGRTVSLGYFATDEEAAIAYDRAAVKHYGEFACLNFPAGMIPA